MKLACVMLAVMLGATLMACGGDGEGEPEASPTAPTQFNESVLTAIVLNPSDVPAASEVSGGFNPNDPTAPGRSFTSIMSTGTLRIQSTIVRYPDEAVATQEFQRSRRVLPAFGAREENADVALAESAFLYRVPNPPGTAIWAIVDNYVVFLQLAPVDTTLNPDPAAVNTEQLDAYAETMLARLNQLIRDPNSVTPVPLEEFAAATPVPTAAGQSSP